MNCAKHVTTCEIKTIDGATYYGENDCLVVQVECPREEGEGYDKCKTVCFQIGHAEEVALLHALHDGAHLEGATATIGHERICDNCKKLLETHGITDFKFKGMNNETKKK